MDEYKEWIKKAERDLEAAKSNIKNGFLEEGAFFLQQSAEKAFKSLSIKRLPKILRSHRRFAPSQQAAGYSQNFSLRDRQSLILHLETQQAAGY
ncbi:HEPN domain-containing protein [Candidatus Pacearchaeota archaeon]|nr:HEPN domain-containing protein [Candidatus Pacearchaeota archaeon]